MGSLLATVLLAVPLIARLGGTFLLDDSRRELARFSGAPREFFLISRKFYSPETAMRPVFPPGRTAADEVS